MKFKHVVKYSFSGIIVTDEKNKIVVLIPPENRSSEYLGIKF